ncbi:MAG: 3-oxoacyl-ACP synthase III family protein [Paludibacteraceae bacterium]
MKAYIKAISYVLPDKIVTNEDLVKEFPEWTVEKIAGKIGIKERRVAAEHETASDLALKAAEKLFSEHNVDKNEIDFVLHCTQSPDYFLPTSACIIQNKLGLRTDVGALDFNLGCSGYVYGLSLAKGLIAANVAQNIILITAETYNKHIHPKDKGNRTIFGDAAAATLVSKEGFAEIGEFSLGTDGKGAENLIVKKGGLRYQEAVNDIIFDEKENPKSSDYLFMDGGAIFNFTSDAVPVLVDKVLENNNLKLTDINLVVFHQANKYMMNYLRKLIGIEKDKFYIYMEKVGNTVSSTIPIALYHAEKDGKFINNVLLAGFGVGYSWGGVILKV